MDKWGKTCTDVVAGIRGTGGTNSQRIEILGSTGKTAKDLQKISKIEAIFSNDLYTMAELLDGKSKGILPNCGLAIVLLKNDEMGSLKRQLISLAKQAHRSLKMKRKTTDDHKIDKKCDFRDNFFREKYKSGVFFCAWLPQDNKEGD